MNKLDINTEMRAFDAKQRDFYDELDDAERKKFSTYLMLKWGSNVEGSPELQEWYLRAQNERVNKNFFDLGKHPKLQWLCCTTVSPGMGARRHYWLKTGKQTGDSEAKRKRKFIEAQLPHLSEDELELMTNLNSMEQIRQWAQELGWDDKKIKAEL